jgi:hypothetical protein
MSPKLRRSSWVCFLLLVSAGVACGSRAGSGPPLTPATWTAIAVPSPSRELAAELSSGTTTPTASPTATTRPTRTPRPASDPRPTTARTAGGSAGSANPVSAGVPAVELGVAPAGRSCPPEAPVKGTRAHVYHTPASRTYETAVPVACFASAADAAQAGYRPASQ